LQEDIQTARQQADVVVVSWHWGISSATGGVGDLVGYQEEVGRFAIDAGADLVVGHHPRMLQPIEVYKGKVIAYCLANYVHDRSEGPPEAVPTMLLRCRISDGEIKEVSFLPGLIKGHGPPTFYRPIDAPDVVNYMRTVSAPFGTQFEVHEDRVSVVL
jgi:poly-gamma-glutamate synthesis protein (capsule biosynthesis protein)